jgi:hypothetical protein
MGLAEHGPASVAQPVHHPDLPQWAITVQAQREHAAGQPPELLVAAGAWQRGVPQVVAQVEVRVINPDGASLLGRHLGNALAIPRDEIKPALDVRAQVVERRRRTVENGQGADVHMRVAVLEAQERRVETGEPIAVSHGWSVAGRTGRLRTFNTLCKVGTTPSIRTYPHEPVRRLHLCRHV